MSYLNNQNWFERFRAGDRSLKNFLRKEMPQIFNLQAFKAILRNSLFKNLRTHFTNASKLLANVCVSSYLVQVQVQSAVVRVHRMHKCNAFWQIIPRVSDSIEKVVCSRLVSSCTLRGELKGMSTAYCLLVFFKLLVFVSPINLLYIVHNLINLD